MNRIVLNNFRVPSCNSMYRRKRGGAVYKTSPHKDFSKELKYALKNVEINLTDKKLCVHIQFYFKGKRKRDLDNCAKSIIDFFQGRIYVNDNQIYKLILEKEMECKEDQIIIEWEEMDEPIQEIPQIGELL